MPKLQTFWKKNWGQWSYLKITISTKSLMSIPFTMPYSHLIIHSPCYQFTPCHPVRIMVHAIHLPWHPLTVSASHHVVQALSHQIIPRWRDLRSFPSCLPPPTLPHSTVNNHLPYSWSSFHLFLLKTILILDLVMSKINYISVVYSFLLVLANILQISDILRGNKN